MSALYRSAEGEARIREQYRSLLDAWPIPHQEVVVPTREGDTFVVVSGREDAPPLVLLHGSGGNSAMWMADVAAWAPHFRLYAVDLIGDPGFSAPSRPRLQSGAYPAWLEDVLDELALGSVAMAGMSLGGWLALDFAVRHPQRITRLVLVSPGGIGRQKMSFLLRMLPLLLFGAWGRRRALAITSGSSAPDPDGHHARYMDFLSLVQEQFHRRMDSLPIFPDATLAGLRMPVLAVLGGRDVILASAATQRRLLAAAPRAGIVWVAGAGHAVTGQSRPILDFLL